MQKLKPLLPKPPYGIPCPPPRPGPVPENHIHRPAPARPAPAPFQALSSAPAPAPAPAQHQMVPQFYVLRPKGHVPNQAPAPASAPAPAPAPAPQQPQMLSQVLVQEPINLVPNQGSKGDVTEPTTSDPNVVGGTSLVPPSPGMMFGSDEEAYSFYNDYAKRLGFGVRISSSKKAKGRISYCLFVCSREGFKKEKDIYVRHEKPSVRVGCMARMRVKQEKEKKLLVTEVVLEHNHELNPFEVKYYNSHKKLEHKAKRKLVDDDQLEARINRLMRVNEMDKGRPLELKEGDAQALLRYFRRMQHEHSRFFFTIQLNHDGCLRHVFWVDHRSRDAFEYFGDVVTLDTTSLWDKYDLKCSLFLGVNHHGQSTLLGCGLIADETIQSYIWLFSMFLEVMGCPPSAIITDQCDAIQGAVKEVFPRVSHRLCLWHIMKKLQEKLGAISEYEAFRSTFEKTIYDSSKVDEFEKEWVNLIQDYKLEHNEWLSTLYEIRRQWVPVFVKESFYAGMSTIQRNESMKCFFDGYMHKKVSLKEFLGKYELALDEKWQKEEKADFISINTSPVMKAFSSYEVQVVKVYTREIFMKFQEELIGMLCCSSIRLVTEEGAISTYVVKQNAYTKDGCSFPSKEYEVFFKKDGPEVHCVCCLFEYKGYLCRHALCVLNFNEVVEIPSHYILSRWRKDFKHAHYRDYRLGNTRSGDKRKRYAYLMKKFTELVEEAVVSDEGYDVALEAYYKNLEKIRYTNKQLQSDSSKLLQDLFEESNSMSPNMDPQGSGLGDTEMEEPCFGTHESNVVTQITTLDPFETAAVHTPLQSLPPLQSLHKGKSSGRLPSKADKVLAKKQNRMNACSRCKEMGHTVRTCTKVSSDHTPPHSYFTYNSTEEHQFFTQESL